MSNGHSQWYKDAIIYEVHVKSFFDSNGDGMGDFQGLTQKLDYLQDLGITAIWLLPFYPSPLKDDGYDIANYSDVHEAYGVLRDFKVFLKEAHKRGLRVITELVINHTSDQHPWFQNARRGGKYQDFYVWSDTPDKFKEARIIFSDFESSNWTWDPVAKKYYWHRFYYHQPDLNFDNPEVRTSIFKILSFWLKMGVDGLRLDAIPYLFEREETNCENLKETHAFLKELRRYVDTHFEDKLLLAEANQWPEDAAKYFGQGDECHMAFHFPVMPRLFMAIHLEDSLPIIEIAGQTPPIPDSCQWALFLRNHDELTLEMVTDEERDYMFRVYAHDPQARINLGIRRRLAPLLKNDRRKIELMNALLFSLTGTPVLYYGDEVGMGDNIYLGDRDGVRTPMQWSNDRNAGFSRANPQKLYLPPIIDPEYHYETLNVEAQSNNPYSLLWWTKQLIALRKRFKAFGHGETRFLLPENRKVLVFIRAYKDELIFIISNLSRYAQYVELDLSQYNGFHLIELFSGETFPKIGELPYFLTLGPYGYYWFAMEKPAEKVDHGLPRSARKIQTFNIRTSIEKFLKGKGVEGACELYLTRQNPGAGRKLKIEKVKILDRFEIEDRHLFILHVIYTTGLGEAALLIFKVVDSKVGSRWMQEAPERVVAKLKSVETKDLSYLINVTEEKANGNLLADMIVKKRRKRGRNGELRGVLVVKDRKESPFLSLSKEGAAISRKERSISFATKYASLKLLTLVEEGPHPDVEMRRFLSSKSSFRSFLPLLGYLQYSGKGKHQLTLALEVTSQPEEFRASHRALEEAEHFLTRIEAEQQTIAKESLIPNKTWLALSKGELPRQMHSLLESYLEVARLLGTETAQFHKACGADSTDEAFAPVGFTLFYQRSLYQTLRKKSLDALNSVKKLKSDIKSQRADLLYLLSEWEKPLMEHLHLLPYLKLKAKRVRIHGNYTLENLIYTGRELLIKGFEARAPLTLHKEVTKQSPLVDVASMLYSLISVAHESVEKLRGRGMLIDEPIELLEERAFSFAIWTGSSFLRSYFREIKGSPLLPTKGKECDFLLSLFLIERALENLSEYAKVDSDKIDLPIKVLLHWLPIYEKVRPKGEK